MANLPAKAYLTCVAGPYPLSFLAAILKMMAGLVVVSMWAAAREELGTTHCTGGSGSKGGGKGSKITSAMLIQH